jgi:hypothetical protein
LAVILGLRQQLAGGSFHAFAPNDARGDYVRVIVKRRSLDFVAKPGLGLAKIVFSLEEHTLRVAGFVFGRHHDRAGHGGEGERTRDAIYRIL